MRSGDNEPYTYSEAGFNRFFRRGLNSDMTARNLSTMARPTNNQVINFDRQQVSGALGDLITIGKITLDGKLGAIIFRDEREEVRAHLGFEEKR